MTLIKSVYLLVTKSLSPFSSFFVLTEMLAEIKLVWILKILTIWSENKLNSFSLPINLSFLMIMFYLGTCNESITLLNSLTCLTLVLAHLKIVCRLTRPFTFVLVSSLLVQQVSAPDSSDTFWNFESSSLSFLPGPEQVYGIYSSKHGDCFASGSLRQGRSKGR